MQCLGETEAAQQSNYTGGVCLKVILSTSSSSSVPTNQQSWLLFRNPQPLQPATYCSCLRRNLNLKVLQGNCSSGVDSFSRGFLQGPSAVTAERPGKETNHPFLLIPLQETGEHFGKSTLLHSSMPTGQGMAEPLTIRNQNAELRALRINRFLLSCLLGSSVSFCRTPDPGKAVGNRLL